MRGKREDLAEGSDPPRGHLDGGHRAQDLDRARLRPARLLAVRDRRRRPDARRRDRRGARDPRSDRAAAARQHQRVRASRRRLQVRRHAELPRAAARLAQARTGRRFSTALAERARGAAHCRRHVAAVDQDALLRGPPLRRPIVRDQRCRSCGPSAWRASARTFSRSTSGATGTSTRKPSSSRASRPSAPRPSARGSRSAA